MLLKKSFLILLFIVLLYAPKTQAFSGVGLGTQIDPYLITTCLELQEIEDDLDAHYKLQNNIDCSVSSGWNINNDEWEEGFEGQEEYLLTDELFQNNGYFGFDPIGEFSDDLNDNNDSYFTGSLDGNDKTISGIWISRQSEPGVGLFSATHNAHIYDLTLTGGTVVGQKFTGGLIGYNKAGTDTLLENITISNLEVFGYLSDYVGGVLGSGSDITIDDLYLSQIEILEFSNYVGGVAGSLTNSSISNVLTNALIINGGEKLGGGFGEISISTINNFDFYGTINSSEAEENNTMNVGGILGIGEDLEITNSETNGSLNLQSSEVSRNFGGFVGSGNSINITDSNSKIDITLSSTPEVSSIHSVGGLVGYAENNIVIANSYATGDITLYSDLLISKIGGLVGYAEENLSIQDGSYSESTISLSESAEYIGGLVGFGGEAIYIEDSYSNSTIELDALNSIFSEDDIYSLSIGGLVGYMREVSQIEDSYNTGNIIINIVINLPFEMIVSTPVYGNIGGLVGVFCVENNQTCEILNSYNTGDISILHEGEIEIIYKNIGGLVGSIPYFTNGSKIEESFSIGEIEVEGGVGTTESLNISSFIGLIEFVDGTSQIINNYTRSNSTITTSPDASTTSNIGGFIGKIEDGQGLLIDKNYSQGIIHIIANTIEYISGFVGYDALGQTVTNNFRVGSLNIEATTSSSISGFLAGPEETDISLYENNYLYHIESSPNTCYPTDSELAGGCDDTTAENQTYFKIQENNPLDVWDFDNVWEIDIVRLVNAGYPYFSYYTPSNQDEGDLYVAPAGVYGCTNVYANNYNSSATIDNGSCTFNNGSISEYFLKIINANHLMLQNNRNIESKITNNINNDTNTSSLKENNANNEKKNEEINITTNTTQSTSINSTPSLETSFVFTKNLRLYQRDDLVRELQRYLNQKGFNLAETGAGSPGNETNFFGPLTLNAVIKFQKENNISPAVGFFGPITRGVVNN